jgi:exodeoxyribonuclease-3
MRIATYNVNGIRSRLPHLLAWLERERPDVACLQELKSLDEGFPADAIRAAGYGALWKGQRSWNGVAILARGAEPLEARRELPGDRLDEHARYLEAAVNGLLVGCIYLPNGNPQPGPKFDYKLAWMARLRRHAAALLKSGQPVVLCGDYNVVPTDADIYDPRSWRHDALLQPESREQYARLLAQGWTDALRHLYPDVAPFTFWDYFRKHWERNAGLRIDHLLLSPDLVPRLRAGGVDAWVRGQEKPSDHAPAWIELEWPAKARKPAARKVAKLPERKRPAKDGATKAPARRRKAA